MMQRTRRQFFYQAAVLSAPMIASALPTFAQQTSAARPLIFDHDGGTPDDFLALALLLTLKDVDLRGVVCSPGVTYLDASLSVSRKILALAGRDQVPVLRSPARSLNAYPTPWRRSVWVADALPILNSRALPAAVTPDAVEWLVNQLTTASAPVTMLLTGSCCTLALALDRQPAIESKIREVVWMGGALRVAGNVSRNDEPSHDGSAEWNVYFDPPAAARVWKSKVPLVLCPLDATNKVPVRREFQQRLATVRHNALGDLAGQLNSFSYANGEEFYFWDLLTAAYVGAPELFRVKDDEVALIADGASAGRTKPEPGARRVKVMDPIEPRAIEDYVLAQWGAK
ncbi:MAG: nucleoside hydrolase [Acidobacteria bacterium]|nr:nucleoside hydrolase [Acidobacteriota bacterium]